MKIHNIYYNEDFLKLFYKLPKNIQTLSAEKQVLFKANPFHPSLRLHKLDGKLKEKWSISINKRYRIIFKILDDGNIAFISIGTHAIYEN